MAPASPTKPISAAHLKEGSSYMWHGYSDVGMKSPLSREVKYKGKESRGMHTFTYGEKNEDNFAVHHSMIPARIYPSTLKDPPQIKKVEPIQPTKKADIFASTKRQIENFGKSRTENFKDILKAVFSTAARKKLAESGAATSWGAYPIRNKADLHNAIQSFGRAKAEDKVTVKQHIIKRANDLGLSAMLPEDWVTKAELNSNNFSTKDPDMSAESLEKAKKGTPQYEAWLEKFRKHKPASAGKDAAEVAGAHTSDTHESIKGSFVHGNHKLYMGKIDTPENRAALLEHMHSRSKNSDLSKHVHENKEDVTPFKSAHETSSHHWAVVAHHDHGGDDTHELKVHTYPDFSSAKSVFHAGVSSYVKENAQNKFPTTEHPKEVKPPKVD